MEMISRMFRLVLWILLDCICCALGLECGYPGAPAFGRPHPLKELYRPGDAVTYSCMNSYSLQGPLQRICIYNGTWSPMQMPLCDRPLPSIDQQASSRMTLGLYPANKSIGGNPQTCAYTDKLRPRWIRVDMRNNQRVRAVALTVPQGIYMQDAAQITIYAISVRDSTTASYHKCASFNGKFSATTLKLTCAGGDVEGRYIHVEDNRHRVDYFSLCEVQVYVKKDSYECGEAERPAHAYSVKTETGAVHYRCVYGYRLEGPSTRVCLSSGQWSLYPPRCIEIVCPLLDGIKNGRIHYVGRKTEVVTFGTMVNVTCEYGYRISGRPLICGEDGQWSRGNLSCQPVDCGIPEVKRESEQYVLLNGTLYGSVALVKCADLEDIITCREDGSWSFSEMDCTQKNGLSRLGLIDEEQNDVPTGIVIGMAAIVFVLLLVVILILLIKRRKVLRQSSTDSLPSKDTSSTLTPNSPQPYDNDAFYATIPVDNDTSNPIEEKRSIMSTILFTRKKTDSKPEDKEDSPVSNGCIYEEIQSKPPESNKVPPGKPNETADGEERTAVYAQIDLEEKRRSRLVKSIRDKFEPLDPPSWGNTYKSEVPPSFDEVDLEPIKLRELPPLPADDTSESGTYASLSIPLEPPTRDNIYQNCTTVKENKLYATTVKKR